MPAIRCRPFLAAATLLGVLALPFAHASENAAPIAAASKEMADAALAFWSSLTPEQQTKAGFTMKDEHRQGWEFVPKPRKGLPMKEMTPAQRHLAMAFLNSGVSNKGSISAASIMSLEQVLYEMENKAPKRDAEMYYVSVFGTPDPVKAWGWRFEGHHLSLNFTLAGGRFIAMAPAFWGTNPGEVREGPRKGLYVQAQDEQLGRAFAKSLTDEQKKTAIIFEAAPKEILTGNARKAVIEKTVGLPYSQMTDAQKAELTALIKYHSGKARPEIAKLDWERIEAAGLDKIHFGWAGSVEVGQPHYYRIHGPTFLVEYDNVQNNANHIHVAWRDLENDFGEDALKKHYEQFPHENK